MDGGSFDFRPLRRSLEEVAKCPVCLELVRPPVIVCVNGHGMCSACKNTITKCTLCSQPFCNVDLRILNDILSNLPQECKYYDEGCRLSSADYHEPYCEFRPIKCPFPKEPNPLLLIALNNCDWEGCASKWTEHVVADHPTFGWIDVHGEKTLKIRNLEDITSEIRIYKNENNCVPLYKMVTLFYYANRNGNLCMYIKQLPLKKPSENIYFILSFKKPDNVIEYRYKIKATTMMTLQEKVDIDMNIFCMRIPIEELKKILNDDGNLYVNYHIITSSL